jgi:hypothetical protein
MTTDNPQNDEPRDTKSPTDGAPGSENATNQPAESKLPQIEAPQLAPVEIEAASATSGSAPVSATAVAAPVEEAASPPSSTLLSFHNFTKRWVPLAATIAIAAGIGAVVGALTAGGLNHMTAGASSPSDTAKLEATIVRLAADLASVQSGIESSSKTTNAAVTRVSDRLDRIEQAQSAPLAKSVKINTPYEPTTTGSVDRSPPPVAAGAPSSSPIIADWMLRSVSDGAAIIQGRIGVLEVRPGDDITGLGRIESIRRHDGRWVVSTSRGLIVTRP